MTGIRTTVVGDASPAHVSMPAGARDGNGINVTGTSTTNFQDDERRREERYGGGATTTARWDEVRVRKERVEQHNVKLEDTVFAWMVRRAMEVSAIKAREVGVSCEGAGKPTANAVGSSFESPVQEREHDIKTRRRWGSRCRK